ncbi:MAG: hypothetical protein KGM24_12195 [Elusimicrobia bacterium]|nr:hypothetical protein [Elusimicrobiota bacterium]
MRKTAAFLAVSALLAAGGTSRAAPAAPAAEKPRTLGVGVVLGAPIGGTAKLWLNENDAIDAGAGVVGDRAAFWGDLLVHDWRLVRQPAKGRLGVYGGLGPEFRSGDEPNFGLRAIAGLDYRPSGTPYELYVEAGPLFELDGGGGTDGVGGLGLRVYLDGSPSAAAR